MRPFRSRRRSAAGHCSLVFLLLLSTVRPVHAQHSIAGVVVDQDGRPVARAYVRAQDGSSPVTDTFADER